jgi:hypothetical protein
MAQEIREGRGQTQTEKQRAAEELKKRRSSQLRTAQTAATTLSGQLASIDKVALKYEALSDHLKGFYDEVDKLTKGKSLIPVTDLTVVRINEVIGDAKNIVSGDAYLDRVKEFVPAGDNPVYPDVLMTARVVSDCLQRFGERLKHDRSVISGKLNETWTIQIALELYGQGTNSPRKELVERHLGDKTFYGWFHFDAVTGAHQFDFEGLDERNLESYLSVHSTIIETK